VNIARFVYIADTTVVLPFTPLTHVWRKSKDLYHLVLLYNIHFKTLLDLWQQLLTVWLIGTTGV
jgi:hypothetical protein